MPPPKLLYTTAEGRRVYPFRQNINGRQLSELHIDPHYEEEHSEYMTDEMIYKLAKQLVQVEKRFIPEAREVTSWAFELAIAITKMIKKIIRGLPENASPEERLKYRIGKAILTYQQDNRLTLTEVAHKLNINETKFYDLCRGQVNAFALSDLVAYLEKLSPQQISKKEFLYELKYRIEQEEIAEEEIIILMRNYLLKEEEE
ncbi:19247_t:CDS:2 [Funneliformis geosporum]|uniref:19247_t:CDS:1 n=1 Tax=Funneliformis geosporum TaxID=1117311 RepID=A0A9W4T953_9GLOM|nr:19247_t:CDS:2 [Funneliformis geosporum]